jgi:NTP pyrophosphohydrolases containing a Zn-finger, probably nucleic-acid-binding
MDWHRRHGFCANCGVRTASASGGWRRDCTACGAQHFPRTDPVVIMLSVRGDRCLLGRQARFAPGMYSCLAGFVEPGETVEDAVRRETMEEAGIRTGRVRYLASQPWPFPSSLMIGCLAEALDDDLVVDEIELEHARWFTRAEVGAMLRGEHPDGLTAPLPFAIAHHLLKAFVDEGEGF